MFALTLSLASCGDNDVLDNAQNQEDILPQSEIRSIDEAYDIAAKSLIWLDGENSRAEIRYLPAKNEIKVVKNKESRGESSDTLMYVVNFEDEQGFAIVPANRNMPELLAVTESGSYDPTVPSEVEPFNEYMDNAISTLSKKDLNIDTLRVPMCEQKIEQTYSISDIVSPKTPYKWGQNGVEGIYCPNNICGCNNLAAALCMCYYNFPTKIKLKHNDNISISINWNALKQHDATKDIFEYTSLGIKFAECFDGVSNEDHNVLGRVCREMGYRSKSEYGSDATSTYPSETRAVLKDLGFSVSTIKEYTNEMEFKKLRENNLILAVGYNDIGSGHMWVIDGYKTVKCTKKIYIRENDPNRVYVVEPEWELTQTYVSTCSYTHHNWGWKGKCNGYFYVSSWNPSSAESYDNTNLTNKSSYNFNSSKYIIIVKK